MSAAKVKHKLPVYEQIHVVVTGEGEIQIVVLIIDELCMSLERLVIVGAAVVFGGFISGQLMVNTAVYSVAARANRIEAKLRNGNAAPAGAVNLVVDKARVGNVSAVIVVVRVVVCRVKAVVGAAVPGGALHETQIAVIVDCLTVAVAVLKGVVQQEIGRIIIGRAQLGVRQLSRVIFPFGLKVRARSFYALTQHGGKLLHCAVVIIGLGAHDVVEVIAVSAVALLYRQRLFQQPCEIVNGFLLIDNSLVRSQILLSQPDTRAARKNGLTCAVRQGVGNAVWICISVHINGGIYPEVGVHVILNALPAVIVRFRVAHQQTKLHIIAAGIVLAVVARRALGIVFRIGPVVKEGDIGDIDDFSAGNTGVECDIRDRLIAAAQIRYLIIKACGKAFVIAILCKTFIIAAGAIVPSVADRRRRARLYFGICAEAHHAVANGCSCAVAANRIGKICAVAGRGVTHIPVLLACIKPAAAGFRRNAQRRLYHGGPHVLRAGVVFLVVLKQHSVRGIIADGDGQGNIFISRPLCVFRIRRDA